MAKPKTLKFDPSARLQVLIGRELMANDYVAISEMIRNGYDAGAKSVTMTISLKSPQKISIVDDGSGMSLSIFQRMWMQPGYSEKGPRGKNGDRPSLGEKGIGRFAVDKIAARLVLTTKIKSRTTSIRADFDWTRFENQNTKLRQIGIPYYEVKDEVLSKLGHGTRLELIGLRKEWAAKDWSGLRKELAKLINPNAPTRGFKILANTPSGSVEEIKPKFSGQSAYHYFFTVSKTGKLVWTLSRPDRIKKQLKEKGANSLKNISGTGEVANSFGAVKGDFYFFEKAAEIKKQGLEAGVSIYRDHFRVEPYGRPDDDWLGIKSLGASRQGHAPITPSKLIGFIQISRAGNPRLKDLTNRDGIQDSEEFDRFQSLVRERFDHFAELIESDSLYLPKSPAISAQIESASRQTRSEAIGSLANQLAHQLRQPMSHIATTSVTLQKYIAKNFGGNANIDKYSQRILSNVARLDANIDALGRLADNLHEAPSEIDLEAFLLEIVQRQQPDFDAAGVELVFENHASITRVKFSQPALEFVVDNYLSNALKAANRGKSNNPKLVTITLADTKNDKVRISVEDSGDGMSEDHQKEIFTKPVASTDGKGLGLFYSKTHVEAFDGEVGCKSDGSGTTVFVNIPTRVGSEQ